MSEEWGDHLILYLYEADGSPIGIQYRNTSYAEDVFDTYWYEKNLQGDIVAVYNQAGTKLIAYNYDAWGNASITYSNGGASTTATYNPFRYRGYYFDSESGFYYLNSRYYDPAIGRFISPDSYINANGDLLGFNMYAYCGNNPVMVYDPTGEFGIIISSLIAMGIGAVFSAGFEIIKQWNNDGNLDKGDWGAIFNKGLVGGALGLSMMLGIHTLGPAFAVGSIKNAAAIIVASAKSIASSVAISVAVSALAGGGGYAIENAMNGRSQNNTRENILGHAKVVALEGASNFAIGGLIGGTDIIGSKGIMFTKEWCIKVFLGSELSKPFREKMDLIRYSIWGD